MRVKVTKTKVYKFAELPDRIQDLAIEKLADINVDYEWWNCIYDDAKNIGLVLTEFDLDRNKHACGHFVLSADEVAANIIRDHGHDCNTYKTADTFIDAKNADGCPGDESDDFPKWEDRMLALEDKFLSDLLEDYSSILQNEYDYLTSREAIIETIEANDYEFDDRGDIA